MTEKTQKKALIDDQLDSFLDDWKKMCMTECPKEVLRFREYRMNLRKTYLGDDETMIFQLPKKLIDSYNHEVDEYLRGVSQLSRKLMDSPYGPAIYNDGTVNEKTMSWFSEYLDRDILHKKQNLYARCEQRIGTPTRIALSRVGTLGEIEGYVYGENGALHIHTITAGGYNIQRLHFRFLMNRVKSIH